MKMLTVSVLVCATMALTGAAAVPKAELNAKVAPPNQEKRIKTSTYCPSGWTAYNSRCFAYFPTAMTWADAERNCMSYGAHLASVHSFAEQRVIQSMIQLLTHTFPLTWLGGYDATQEGTWFWSDGTRFDFKYWDIGQPDNWGNAHCLAMNFGDSKRFDDQPCYYKRPSVCALKK